MWQGTADEEFQPLGRAQGTLHATDRTSIVGCRGGATEGGPAGDLARAVDSHDGFPGAETFQLDLGQDPAHGVSAVTSCTSATRGSLVSRVTAQGIAVAAPIAAGSGF